MSSTRTDPPGFAGLIGLAQVDITPPVGIRNKNWGPAESEVASGVHRPFVATALALQRPDADPLVLIGVDGTWWRRTDDELRTRRAVLEAVQLPASNVVISLSHTHAGCVFTSSAGELPGGTAALDYLARLGPALAEVARQAIANLAPGTIDWLTGHCGLAGNREAIIDEIPYVAWNPELPADDTVVVGRIAAADSRTIGTLVNYACHPTTLAWQNEALSPDYVGTMRELVEQATGAPVLFIQGASGDLAPREQYTGDVTVADRHGRSLGHAVLAVLETAPPPGQAWQLTELVESGAPLGVWQPKGAHHSDSLSASRHEVGVQLAPVLTEEELIERWGADIDPRSLRERLSRLRDLRDGYLEPGMTSVSHPFWLWQLGDALLVAQPGEAYASFQQELRAAFPDRPIVVGNLCNGPGFAYLPDDAAYQRGAYQAWQTPFAAGSLATLTKAVVAAIRTAGPTG